MGGRRGLMGLQRQVRRMFGDRSFADTLIPFTAVAADLSSWRSVALQEGPLWPAVVASCSIPVIFPPLRYQGRLLVDGGLLEPVPCPTLRRTGADLVIAINTNCTKQDIALWRDQGLLPQGPRGRPGHGDGPGNVFSITLDTFVAMSAEISAQALRGADLCIQPRFDTLSWYDIAKIPAFVEAGAVAVQEATPELRRLLPWLG